MAWSAGAILTAAQLNTYLPQTWTNYTPTLAGFTASSTIAKYIAIGHTVHVSVSCTLNAAPSGSMTVTLPVTGATTNHIGVIKAADAGTANHVGLVLMTSTTVVSFVPAPSSGGIYNATIPFTWVSGDSFVFSLTYESA